LCDVRVRDIRVGWCEGRTCDIRVCDVRVCDIRVGWCEGRMCDIRVCDIRVLDAAKFDSGCGWPAFYEVLIPAEREFFIDNLLVRIH